MPVLNLTSASFGGLGNGYLGKLIDKGLADIVQDIDDRGDEDGATRTLTVTVAFKPSKGQVAIVPKVATKLPALVPPLTVAEMRVGTDGKKGLAFHPASAANPQQKTFADQLADDEADAA